MLGDEPKLYTARAARRSCWGMIALGLAWVLAIGSQARGQTTVLSDGFEGAFPGAWFSFDAEPTGPSNYWGAVDFFFGGEGAHSGGGKLYCAAVGFEGTSSEPRYRVESTPTIQIPVDLAGYSRAILRFWYRIPSIESDFDSCQVMFSSGLGTATLWSSDTETRVWTRAVVDLDPFVGQNRTLSFVLNSDELINGEGWYLDDVAVIGGHGPAHDFFDRPLVLSGGSGTVTGSVATAAKELGEPVHAGNTGGRSVWFAWTAASTNEVRFDTLGSDFDTLLAVYTGDLVQQLTPVVSNDDIEAGILQSLVFFRPVAGQTYWVAADAFDGQGRNLRLNWSPHPITPFPALVSATNEGNPTMSLVRFSEPLSVPSGFNPEHYAFSPALQVYQVDYDDDPNVVRVFTDPLQPDVTYTVIVHDVRDADYQLLSPNPSQVSFTFGAGFPEQRILYQRFDVGGGALLSDLTNNPAFPEHPDSYAPVDRFEVPPNAGDNYGAMLCGMFLPPVSGTYRFYMAADGPGAAYIATNGLALHKRLLAYEPLGSGPRDYTGLNRRDPVAPENRSAPLFLAAGQPVYLEAIMKEQAGADHLSVAVQLPGQGVAPTEPMAAALFMPVRSYQATRFSQFGEVSFTVQPGDQTVAENGYATFRVSADGTPPYRFEWYLGDEPVGGEQSSTLTVGPVTPGMNGRRYMVLLENDFSSLFSSSAVLRVVRDQVAPEITRALADPSFRRVRLSFSEALANSATNTTNFVVRDPLGAALPISRVQSVNPSNLVIELAVPMPSNQLHSVTINGVRDRAATPNSMLPGTIVFFSSWTVLPGQIAEEYYDGLDPGETVDLLLQNPKFPDRPDQRRLTDRFATLTNRANQYGVRVSGFFVPSVSGSHVFFVASDDPFRLYLSSSSDPAGKSLLVEGNGCCLPIASNASPARVLQAGVPYYIEGLMKENYGDDFLRVSVAAGGDATPPELLPPVGAGWLRAPVNPDSGGQLIIRQHPLNTVIQTPQSATFTVGATNTTGQPLSYEWQVNFGSGWTAVAGATGASYTTPPVELGMDGWQYRAVLEAAGQVGVSRVATLDVVADAQPPQWVSGASLGGTNLALCFSEALNSASAQDPSHYLVEGVQVLAAVLQPDGRTVVLTLNQAVASPVVRVSGVSDVGGNIMAEEAAGVAATWATALDVGAPAIRGQAVSCAAGEVDVVSAAIGLGGAADQLHFVHQMVENNFDVRVRLGRLDAVDAQAQAGLMVRASLAADSPMLAVFTTPFQTPGTGMVQAHARSVAGGLSQAWGDLSGRFASNAWLRLQRTGNSFLAYYSTNGVTWTNFAQTNLVLPSAVLVGLGVASDQSALGTTASFRGFQFVPAGPALTQLPQGVVTTPGSDAMFQVVAAGPAPLSYQWRFNGQNIAGATAPTLVITNVQVEQGGAYTVLVSNQAGATNSPPAVLSLALPSVLLADNFSDAPLFTTLSGCAEGSNVGATVQSGEPRHADQPGGRSVWLRWQPATGGVATVRTHGSALDTLLGVYRGTTPSTLAEVVANDDDAGGGYTSLVQFRAEPGQVYVVAVDGMGGAEGNIVVCWDLVESTQVPPVFTEHPQSRSATLGSSLQLRGHADGAGSYQWYFNGAPLTDETNEVLVLNPVSLERVGSYWLEASPTNGVSPGLMTARSRVAAVEVGSYPDAVSRDRVEELADETASGQEITVAAGEVGMQVLSNAQSGTSAGEEAHCGLPGYATRWLLLRCLEDGLEFQIDTGGSTIGTMLAVYRSAALGGVRTLETCGAGLGTSNSVAFPAVAGSYYWVVLDGAGGAVGRIHVRWKLGRRPVITTQPSREAVRAGQDAILSVAANGVPPPAYQWYQSGIPIQGGTNATYVVENVTAPGEFKVVAWNELGQATSLPAQVALVLPIELQLERLPDGRVRIELITGTALASYYMVEASANLQEWQPIFAQVGPTPVTEFIDEAAANLPVRFYRVRELSP